MFRSRPENFTFAGLEDDDRKSFSVEPAPNDRDLAKPPQYHVDAGGALWAPTGVGSPVHAAACALACKARKRIMLWATANHSRWMRALILPRKDNWRRPMRRAWALMHSCSARSR